MPVIEEINQLVQHADEGEMIKSSQLSDELHDKFHKKYENEEISKSEYSSVKGILYKIDGKVEQERFERVKDLCSELREEVTGGIRS